MKKILHLLFTIITLAAVPVILQSCSKEDSGDYNNNGESGTGGSMARFTVCGDYIYTVDNQSLKITWIKDPANPVEINQHYLSDFSGDIETIFPYDNKLFIGSQSAMYIYDLSANPRNPKLLSKTTHFRSCDPVVAYGDRAYVTLNNASVNCGGRGDFLLIYDISPIMNPTPDTYYYQPMLLPGGTYEYYGNIHPAGLGVDGPAGKLFVCTNIGVEVYDINEEDPMKPLTYVSDLTDIDGVGIIDAYDVIPLGGLLIVIGDDGLFQFDYTKEKIEFLGSIKVERKQR